MPQIEKQNSAKNLSSTEYLLPDAPQAFMLERKAQAVASSAEAALKAQNAAKTYLKTALKRIEENYGIIIKTGMELECYVLDRDGNARDGLLNPQIVHSKLVDADIAQRFDNENIYQHFGQYEAMIGIFDPLETAERATSARSYINEFATEFGVVGFTFAPRPFPEKESSSAHISFSLWSLDGRPLFVDEQNQKSALMKQIARGLLETQKSTAILYAQTDEAYTRFGNTIWSPNSIGLGDSGDQGTSLRFSARNDFAYPSPIVDPKEVRIEDRLSASDSDYYIAMAATVAGIDYALTKYVKAFDHKAFHPEFVESNKFTTVGVGEKILVIDKLGVETFPQFDLPENREKALKLLEVGLIQNLRTIPEAQPFFEAVLNMHQKPESVLETRDTNTPEESELAKRPRTSARLRRAGITPIT